MLLFQRTRRWENIRLLFTFTRWPIQNLSCRIREGPGRTVYIGETCRETGSWRRFPAHFSPSLEEGLSTLINHTLSTYYHSGTALNLRVFRVLDGRSTKEAERIMLRAHLHAFGAYPLGQGGTGKDNTPKEVSRLFSEQRELHESCLELFACPL